MMMPHVLKLQAARHLLRAVFFFALRRQILRDLGPAPGHFLLDLRAADVEPRHALGFKRASYISARSLIRGEKRVVNSARNCVAGDTLVLQLTPFCC